MIGNLVRNWWTFVLQGVLAIGVGVAAFLVPGPTLAAFIAVIAAYAIVTGVFEIVGGFSMANGPKWSLVGAGVAGIAVGALAIAQPAGTASTAPFSPCGGPRSRGAPPCAAQPGKRN